MKRSIIRASSLLKGFVLALIFSVFLQASLASASGATELNQTNFYSTITADILGEDGVSTGGSYVLIESINIADVNDSATVFGTFTGILDGNYYSISGLTKPLFDVISQAPATFVDGIEIDTVEVKNLNLESSTFVDGNGALANVSHGTIDNVSSSANVMGLIIDINDEFVGVGGLVGTSYGTITNSDVTGTVDGDSAVGGLVGILVGDISNSYATGGVTGDITNLDAYGYTGGLVGISYGDITNSYAAGEVDGGAYAVGGLVGYSAGDITNSYATGEVVGIELVGGLVGGTEGNITNSFADVTVTGSNNVGGLVGESTLTSTINYSIAAGTVTGTDNVGGLVGSSAGTINNSFADVTVTGSNNVGGLVGFSSGDISNSYATGLVTGSSDYVGGLVGESGGYISNSYAIGDVTGVTNVGGLAGYSYDGITNSYAAGVVTGIGNNVGGLVGLSDSPISNSYAIGAVTGRFDIGGLVGESGWAITNSYAIGAVTGIDRVGGLVGFSSRDIDFESYAIGAVTGTDNVGGLVGRSEGTFDSLPHGEDGIDNGSFDRSGPVRNLLSIVNTSLVDDFVPAFEVDALINGGMPYLTYLELSYDVVEEDTEETPSFSLRSYYTQAAKSLDKALTPFGFKSNFSSHPTLGFQALEQNQSNSPAAIQLFEVSDYQNSNILLSKEDGLQLSISSYYKEPVEIWTQGLDGEYLYLGLVEFDEDGKAILPTLKFDTANTYQLLMIKAADKLNEKPNLEAKVGQININVF